MEILKSCQLFVNVHVYKILIQIEKRIYVKTHLRARQNSNTNDIYFIHMKRDKLFHFLRKSSMTTLYYQKGDRT